MSDEHECRCQNISEDDFILTVTDVELPVLVDLVRARLAEHEDAVTEHGDTFANKGALRDYCKRWVLLNSLLEKAADLS